MTTFTWSPAPGAAVSVAPRVRTAAYGDGYMQRVADGINNKKRSWSLTFTRLTADIDAIDAFLAARGGVESFDWVPPKGLPGKFICQSWNQTVTAAVIQSISATFEEVFGS